MIKKLGKVLIATSILLTPLAAKAEGAIVGTDAYALAADSLANVFFQGKIDGKSAYLIEVASASGITLLQGSYKYYFGGEYANAPYLAGGLLYASDGTNSATGFMGKIGYDFPVGDKVVLSPFYGIGNVSGFTVDGVGFNVGMKL